MLFNTYIDMLLGELGVVKCVCVVIPGVLFLLMFCYFLHVICL